MNETILKMTPNSRENAAKLSYGSGYWVEYFDWKSGEVRAAIGIAVIGSKFHFPALRLREVPTMIPCEEKNYIIGWYRAKDYRLVSQDEELSSGEKWRRSCGFGA